MRAQQHDATTAFPAWNTHAFGIPPDNSPETVPFHVSCSMLAAVTTFFVALLRHSSAAVVVLVLSTLAVWWNAVFRPLAEKEKTSAAYLAAYGLWQAWMISGLLWRETTEDTEDDVSLAALLITDVFLPGCALYISTSRGYIGVMQDVANVVLWIGIIFTGVSSHVFGPHTQLLHVAAGAARVLLFFFAFLFFHYWRVELPEGEHRPMYPEANRVSAQDRTTLVLAGWILLSRFFTMMVVLPTMSLLFWRTMAIYADRVKKGDPCQRRCFCGNMASRDIEAGIARHPSSEHVVERPVSHPLSSVAQAQARTVHPSLPLPEPLTPVHSSQQYHYSPVQTRHVVMAPQTEELQRRDSFHENPDPYTHGQQWLHGSDTYYSDGQDTVAVMREGDVNEEYEPDDPDDGDYYGEDSGDEQYSDDYSDGSRSD